MSSSCSSFCNVFVTVSIIALMYIFWYVLFAVSGLQVEKDAESMKQHMLMRHTLLAMLPEEASSDDYDAIVLRVRLPDSSIISRRFHGQDGIQVSCVDCHGELFMDKRS